MQIMEKKLSRNIIIFCVMNNKKKEEKLEERIKKSIKKIILEVRQE